MNPSSMRGNNRNKSREAAPVSASLEKRLLAYAASASAAGVALLAIAQPAEARIVYTAAHRQVPLKQSFYLDLNHDGIQDFRFVMDWFTTSGQSIVELLAYPAQQGNGIWSAIGFPSPCAAALPKGRRIGPKSPFASRYVFMFEGSGPSATYCPWNTRGKLQAYLGLRFSIKGKVHFGWARFVTHSRPHPTAELTGYAYETIAGKPIVAGATKGPEDAEQPGSASLKTRNSEAATLGALALGVPGLDIWRREGLTSAAH
jgi:hypothetical protein